MAAACADGTGEEREGGETTTLAELLGRSARALAAAGIEAPMREARILVGHALGLGREALLRLGSDAVVPMAASWALVRRRAGREPLAFIVGRQPFRSLDLAVGPATLIPRLDTETVVEAALDAAGSTPVPRLVLDLGTGTGAILLALLAEWPDAWGIGTDRSEAACRLATGNAEAAGLGDRARFVTGDWDAALGGDGSFDIVVSNPPYVPTGEIASLMPEVAGFEPALALDGGPDGLECYRRLLPAIGRLLAPEGAAVVEIGAGRDAAVGAIAAEAELEVADQRRDGSFRTRALVLRRPVRNAVTD